MNSSKREADLDIDDLNNGVDKRQKPLPSLPSKQFVKWMRSGLRQPGPTNEDIAHAWNVWLFVAKNCECVRYDFDGDYFNYFICPHREQPLPADRITHELIDIFDNSVKSSGFFDWLLKTTKPGDVYIDSSWDTCPVTRFQYPEKLCIKNLKTKHGWKEI